MGDTVSSLIWLRRIAWMQLGNAMRAGPVPLSRLLNALRQNSSSLEHIREHTITIIDHLGTNIPMPFLFCSTWEVGFSLFTDQPKS
jgi:hypothetical protein